MSVSEFTKKYVRNRADYLCEYCHSPEKISASRFTIDHLQPRSLKDLSARLVHYGSKQAGIHQQPIL